MRKPFCICNSIEKLTCLSMIFDILVPSNWKLFRCKIRIFGNESITVRLDAATYIQSKS